MSATSLPTSYADLPLKDIRVSNYPADAKGVTPIQVVTLYRPNAHNAFTRTMMDEMVNLWGAYDVDDRVKVIVLTGHGKMFCAGADLQTGFQRNFDDRINDHRDGYVSF